MKIGDLVQHRHGGMKALVFDFDEDGDPIIAFLGQPIGDGRGFSTKVEGLHQGQDASLPRPSSKLRQPLENE